MGRIEENERRLDKLNTVILSLDKHLDDFENIIHDYYALNEYYGSKKWFKDKSDFEKRKIKNTKAGVLSEDAIWNLDENVRDLINRMDQIIKLFNEDGPK